MINIKKICNIEYIYRVKWNGKYFRLIRIEKLNEMCFVYFILIYWVVVFIIVTGFCVLNTNNKINNKWLSFRCSKYYIEAVHRLYRFTQCTFNNSLNHYYYYIAEQFIILFLRRLHLVFFKSKIYLFIHCAQHPKANRISFKSPTFSYFIERKYSVV